MAAKPKADAVARLHLELAKARRAVKEAEGREGAARLALADLTFTVGGQSRNAAKFAEELRFVRHKLAQAEEYGAMMRDELRKRREAPAPAALPASQSGLLGCRRKIRLD